MQLCCVIEKKRGKVCKSQFMKFIRNILTLNRLKVYPAENKFKRRARHGGEDKTVTKWTKKEKLLVPLLPLRPSPDGKKATEDEKVLQSHLNATTARFMRLLYFHPYVPIQLKNIFFFCAVSFSLFFFISLQNSKKQP